ncbi:MAG: L,D-transpeptidase family protein [Candidatus Promineifilaceae bacterium]
MAAALMQQARKAIREGRLVDARRLLRQVIHEEPNNHAAWLLLARATPDKKLAAQYIDRARYLQPDSPLVQRAEEDLAANKTAATTKFSYSWLLLPILVGTLLILGLVGLNYRQSAHQQVVLKPFESVDRVAAAPADTTQEEPARTFETSAKNLPDSGRNSQPTPSPSGPQTQDETVVVEESPEIEETPVPMTISDSNQALPSAILMGIDKESAANESDTPTREALPNSTPVAEDGKDEQAEKPGSDASLPESDLNTAVDETDTNETNADLAMAADDTITDADMELETQDLEDTESEVIIEDDTANDDFAQTDDRWIDVNLTTQTLTAYEGQTPVLYSLISSGMWQFPTVTGQFHTYMKYEYQDMSGYHLGYNYDLADVPHVMYFFEDYAIHGAYWHNNFGTPMSHGCVNVNLPDAAWLYNWAPVGTLVNVHY